MEKTKRGFNPGEAIIPGVSLAFGIAYFVQTKDASMVAIKWPYILAALTGVLWLGVVSVYLFSPRTVAAKTVVSRSQILKPILILVAPIAYIIIMPYLGFALSSMLFLAMLFRRLGGESWIRNIGIAFLITAFLYMAMVVLMKMSLPRLAIGSFLL